MAAVRPWMPPCAMGFPVTQPAEFRSMWPTQHEHRVYIASTLTQYSLSAMPIAKRAEQLPRLLRYVSTIHDISRSLVPMSGAGTSMPGPARVPHHMPLSVQSVPMSVPVAVREKVLWPARPLPLPAFGARVSFGARASGAHVSHSCDLAASLEPRGRMFH